MNGRTYSGHYKGHYLKSTLEFIYAKYLDHMGINWDYEVKTFKLSTGGSYKPDFYLCDSGEYVEIKGSFNFKEDLSRIKTFEQDQLIKVLILQESDLRKLLKPTPLVFSHLQKEWVSRSRVFGLNTAGKNNPRYGVTLSSATRSKIGAKARERFKDPIYVKKWKESCLKSEKVQANTERLAQMARDSKLPSKSAVCSHCKQEFLQSEYFQIAKNTQYCSRFCAIQVNIRKASPEKIKAVKLIAQSFAQDNQEQLKNLKWNKLKEVMSPFYSEVFEKTGIKDIRTICTVLLGSESNRKELAKFLQSLV